MTAPRTDPAAADDRPVLARMAAGVLGMVASVRRRWRWFDHLARAGGRYTRMQGDLMAAGVTYFAFLSIFPIVLLIAAVIGLVLSGDELLREQITEAIRDAVPGETGDRLVDQVEGAISSSGVAGAVGLAGFVYAGLRTMDKLRVGVRRVWTGRPVEPDFLRDNLQDLASFALLGLAGLLSVALTGGATTATSWVLGWLGLDDAPGFSLLTTVLGIALALAGDTVIFLWLLKVVPATPSSLRRLLPGALLGAAGFEVLKVLGSFYLALISGSVTASAFGGAVGILVWINLVARLALFTAAWTATLPAVERAPVPWPTRGEAAPAAVFADGPTASAAATGGPGAAAAPPADRVRTPVGARRPVPPGAAAGLVGVGVLAGAAAARLLPELLRRGPGCPPEERVDA